MFRCNQTERESAVADDDTQDVVEIMSDPASQSPHGFHFLGLAELGFEALALGDVASNRQHALLSLDVDDFRRHLYLQNLSRGGAALRTESTYASVFR